MRQSEPLFSIARSLQRGQIRSRLLTTLQAKMPEFGYIILHDEDDLSSHFSAVYTTKEKAYEVAVNALRVLMRRIYEDRTVYLLLGRDSKWEKVTRIYKIRIPAPAQFRREWDDGVDENRPAEVNRGRRRFIEMTPDLAISYQEIVYWRVGPGSSPNDLMVKGLGDEKTI